MVITMDAGCALGPLCIDIVPNTALCMCVCVIIGGEGHGRCV